jgi:hypothetical protein
MLLWSAAAMLPLCFCVSRASAGNTKLKRTAHLYYREHGSRHESGSMAAALHSQSPSLKKGIDKDLNPERDLRHIKYETEACSITSL